AIMYLLRLCIVPIMAARLFLSVPRHLLTMISHGMRMMASSYAMMVQGGPMFLLARARVASIAMTVTMAMTLTCGMSQYSVSRRERSFVPAGTTRTTIRLRWDGGPPSTPVMGT